MNAVARLVLIDQAADGMVLSKDVQGAGGSVLIAGGTRLTVQLIESLRCKGVHAVHVEDGAQGCFTDEQIEAAVREVREDVLSRFRKDPAGTSMEGIFKAVLRLEAMRRLANGQNS